MFTDNYSYKVKVKKSAELSNSYKFNSFNSSDGFTLIEMMIAIILSMIVIGSLVTLAVSTTKNSKFVEKLVGTNILLSQKTTQLFNNASAELAKIPKDETRAGSINPAQPVAGYFDITNESGCVIKSGISPIHGIDPTTKDISYNSQITSSKTGKGGLGDIGGDSGGDSGSDFSPLDCSRSTFNNNSQSLEPKFRRQWVVIKDFPSLGDVSFSVVIVAIQTNQITSSSIISKGDGFASK